MEVLSMPIGIVLPLERAGATCGSGFGASRGEEGTKNAAGAGGSVSCGRIGAGAGARAAGAAERAGGPDASGATAGTGGADTNGAGSLAEAVTGFTAGGAGAT